ncbi:unnamed protein product [Nesidiocoris tenuis]|uniref:Uncharacterized protein n=1 Tax=Nesidiocoris tenuis TaxID=355587 RepID=A0A6H5G0X0_9HEMI|nr:unnamed protein product [Nesidiocoris tenuis]
MKIIQPTRWDEKLPTCSYNKQFPSTGHVNQSVLFKSIRAPSVPMTESLQPPFSSMSLTHVPQCRGSSPRVTGFPGQRASLVIEWYTDLYGKSSIVTKELPHPELREILNIKIKINFIRFDISRNPGSENWPYEEASLEISEASSAMRKTRAFRSAAVGTVTKKWRRRMMKWRRRTMGCFVRSDR